MATVNTETLDRHTAITARSAQEITSALTAFVANWRNYDGGEVEEAHTFLDQLFEAYGLDRRGAGVRYEASLRRADGTTGFTDAILPGKLLIEMKRPSKAATLEEDREQAFDYWQEVGSRDEGVPAPRYTLLCAFHRFMVYEFGRYPREPIADFTLDELPDNQGALRFLAGQRPTVVQPNRELTATAAEAVVRLYHGLVARDAAEPIELRSFILQTVWCLFASDLGVLAGHPVQEIVNDLLADAHDRRSSAAELGHLYRLLNLPDQHHPDRPSTVHQQQGGVFAGKTKFVNGGLFATPAAVHLTREELETLRDIGRYRWRDVDPTIFGSLIEGFLERDRAIDDPGARRQFGVHYTHADDIRKIVTPSIVEPWQARIRQASTADEALDVLASLCKLRVLDSACGSANFLYIAYQEIRGLEREAREKLEQLSRASGVEPPNTRHLQFPLQNLYGIELDEFAVQVARVVLWMGHEIAGRDQGTPEPLLPLPDLSATIVQGDALEMEWPAVDIIISNPPFNGSQRLREAIGDDAIERLKSQFGIGVKDYCVYWFRKAVEHLPPGGRAGLVATNSIAHGGTREASLDYVVEQGGVLTDVVPSQTWQGDAAVHVAIVNWIHQPDNNEGPLEYRIDHAPVADGIGSDLRPAAVSVVSAVELPANDGIAFQGPIPGNRGFVLDNKTAAQLLQRDDADYTQVVKRYLTSDDIASSPLQEPSRWIIDFGHRELQEAKTFSAAIEIVERDVKPERMKVRRESNRRRWWQFVEPRRRRRAAIADLSRYLAVGRHGKRILLTWCKPEWIASDATVTIALDGDYHFGVLTSRAHVLWAAYRGSSIKSDPRYTHTTVFRSFPWPTYDDDQREAIAAAARKVTEHRASACADANAGLTEVYNIVEDGGYPDLMAAHRDLDRAVAAAYGWPVAIAGDAYEVIPRLLALNHQIDAGAIEYAPFADHPTRQDSEDSTDRLF
jgi:hypothetical protein